MTDTGLRALDRSVQKTREWLAEVQDGIGDIDEDGAYLVTKAVLHVLRDQMTPEEVGDLAAQLPMVMRGFFYEDYRPGKRHPRLKTQERLNDAVGERLQDMLRTQGAPSVDPGLAVDAVVAMLSRHVSSGEIEDIKAVLPKDLKSIWPESAET